jgi:hypothetical protein
MVENKYNSENDILTNVLHEQCKTNIMYSSCIFWVAYYIRDVYVIMLYEPCTFSFYLQYNTFYDSCIGGLCNIAKF